MMELESEQITAMPTSQSVRQIADTLKCLGWARIDTCEMLCAWTGEAENEPLLDMIGEHMATAMSKQEWDAFDEKCVSLGEGLEQLADKMDGKLAADPGNDGKTDSSEAQVSQEFDQAPATAVAQPEGDEHEK